MTRIYFWVNYRSLRESSFNSVQVSAP